MIIVLLRDCVSPCVGALRVLVSPNVNGGHWDRSGALALTLRDMRSSVTWCAQWPTAMAARRLNVRTESREEGILVTRQGIKVPRCLVQTCRRTRAEVPVLKQWINNPRRTLLAIWASNQIVPPSTTKADSCLPRPRPEIRLFRSCRAAMCEMHTTLRHRGRLQRPCSSRTRLAAVRSHVRGSISDARWAANDA
jgi:hypothetical protein